MTRLDLNMANECEHDKRFGGVFGAVNGCLACHAERIAEENTRLRKIMAHVPARVAIKAKEDAGFANTIRTAENQP
jgi:hypothetical protein